MRNPMYEKAIVCGLICALVLSVLALPGDSNSENTALTRETNLLQTNT
jgi:hypothetical protein